MRCRFELNPNDYVNLETNAYYTDHSVKPYSPYKNPKDKGTDMHVGVKTYGGKILNKSKFDTGFINQTLVYGGEYYIAKSYNKKQSVAPDDEAKSLSLFLEDQFRAGGFTLTPGIRYDHYELDTMGGELGKAGRANYSWNEWSPGFSLDYQFDIGLGFYASWAKVFRGPDPVESIRVTGENVYKTTTNGDLDAETGDDYEFGARYRTEFAQNQSLSLSAKYFYDDYDNLIVEMAEPRKTEFQRQNGGRAVVKGGEIVARYSVGNLSLGASYSKTKTTYKDPNNTAGYGRVLAYSDAGDKYTFNAEYFVPYIDTLFGYNLIAFDKITTKNGAGKEFTKPGYAVSDIYATWTPSKKYKGLEINLGIYNIFDKAYWSHSQRSAGSMQCPKSAKGKCPPNPLEPGPIDWDPGRNIKASVSYKF